MNQYVITFMNKQNNMYYQYYVGRYLIIYFIDNEPLLA